MLYKTLFYTTLAFYKTFTAHAGASGVRHMFTQASAYKLARKGVGGGESG